MRRLESYLRKYGPEFGPRLFHALQSQAAHAGVSARLRRKIDVLTGKSPVPPPHVRVQAPLPLFSDTEPEPAATTHVETSTSMLEQEGPVAIGA